MNAAQVLSALALRCLPGNALEPVLGSLAVGSARPALAVADVRPRLGRALRRAYEQSWLAIELLLAGAPAWERLRNGAVAAGACPFRTVAAAAGDRLVATDEPVQAFRRRCWDGLQAARREGLISALSINAGPSPGESGAALEQPESHVLTALVDELEQGGRFGLRGLLLELPDTTERSFVVGLIAAFYRLAIDDDPDLSEDAPDGHETETDDLPDIEALAALLDAQPAQVESLLGEVRHGGAPTTSVDKVAGLSRLQKGLALAQRGEYERAVVEFTAAMRFDPELAAAYTGRGDAFRLTGDYERAAADYSTALRLDPGNVRAAVQRGLMHWLGGRHDDAIADFTGALQRDPAHAAAHYHRGNAHADLGNYEAASADFSEAIRLDPSFTGAWHARGNAHLDRGDYDRAVADFSRVLQIDPTFTLALVQRGYACSLKGEYERAVADYSAALQLDPQQHRAYLFRGEAYWRLGDLERAHADISAGLRLDPDNSGALANRGIVSRLLGRLDPALADFDQSLRLDPTVAEVHYNRGLTNQAAGRLEHALADFDQALLQRPGFAAAHYSRGTIYAALGRLERAADEFAAALEHEPGMVPAYLARALVHQRAGQASAVVADCTQALALDARLGQAYALRGTAHLRLGAHEAAIADLTHALEFEPDNARHYNERGLAYSKQGSYDPAYADFTRAIQLDPTHAQALSNRGVVSQLRGRHEQALDDFARAVQLDAKYAVSYSCQLGLVHANRGEFDRALADFAMALALDPDNASAQDWREQAVQAKAKQKVREVQRAEADVDFGSGQRTPTPERTPRPAVVRTPPPAPPARPHDTAELPHKPAAVAPIRPQDTLQLPPVASARAHDTAELAPDEPAAAPPAAAPTMHDGAFEIDLSGLTVGAAGAAGDAGSEELIELTADEDLTPAPRAGPVRPRRRTPTAKPAAAAAPADEGLSLEAATSDEDQRAYEAEQREMELAAKRAKADEILRAQQLRVAMAQQAAAQPEKPKKPARRTVEADDDDPDAVRQMWLKRGLVAAAVLVVGYYGLGWLTRPTMRITVLPAEQVWADYSKDAASANKKYAKQGRYVSGNVVLRPMGKGKLPLVFFRPPTDDSQLWIQCTDFVDAGTPLEIDASLACEIYGVFQPYDGGQVVELKECLLRKQFQKTSSVSRRIGNTDDFCENCFQRLAAMPTPGRQAANLIEFYLPASCN